MSHRPTSSFQRSAIPWNLAALAFIVVAVSGILWSRKPDALLDDAYLFARYVHNMRAGFGISWNPDGVHTYGCTSLLWLMLLWALSFVHALTPGAYVTLCIVCYLCAVGLISWKVASTAKSGQLGHIAVTALVISLPLQLNFVFFRDMANGMETMLAFLMHTLLALAALGCARRGTKAAALYAAIACFAVFATRPEGLLCGLLTPLLAILLLSTKNRARQSGVFLGSATVLIALQLILAHFYFGTALPLPFYVKSVSTERTYIGYDGPVQSLADFAVMLAVPVFLLLLCGNKKHTRLLIVLLVPALVTAAYLTTVVQIMGMSARYYIPLVSYFVLASLYVLDDALAAGEQFPDSFRFARLVRAGTVIAIVSILLSPTNYLIFAQHARSTYLKFYPAVPQPTIVAATPGAERDVANIVLHYVQETHDTADLANSLKPGTVIAATDIGYVGAVAAKANLIDLGGLNDADFSVRHAPVNTALDRHPEFLVLPWPMQTRPRADLFRDPRLLRDYDVYFRVLDFGVAVRKAAPQHDYIMQRLQSLIHREEPGRKLEDFRVIRIFEQPEQNIATQE